MNYIIHTFKRILGNT